ncbi:MAG: hypothetical protein ACK41V_02570 [Acidovorax sp.]|uniref:hypothetical protein n=1 Tax=Acidovorax sp. TaxID=1872122 RepID=UPI003918C46C
MRELAAELPPEAAEVQADLHREEIALADKNSFVLIGTIYDNLLMDVFFLGADLSFGVTGTRGVWFWIQAPGVFQEKRAFCGLPPRVSQYPCKVRAVTMR